MIHSRFLFRFVQTLNHLNWYTRLAGVNFLSTFLSRHAGLLNSAIPSTSSSAAPLDLRSLALTAFQNLLGDAQPEVAQAASKLLSGSLSGVLIAAPVPAGRGWGLSARQMLELGIVSETTEEEESNESKSEAVNEADDSALDEFGNPISSTTKSSSVISSRGGRLNQVIIANVNHHHLAADANEQRDALIKTFKKWARAKKPAAAFTRSAVVASTSASYSASASVSTASTEAETAALLTRTRLAGLLGWSALVQSEPFAVPAWLPGLLDELVNLSAQPKLVRSQFSSLVELNN